jgi:hypothetical protein
MFSFQTLKSFKELILGAGDVPKFGQGTSETECANCTEVTVFMVCYGQTSAEKRRISVPRDTPLARMRDLFGREMGQEVMADENYFVFNDSELTKPLYMFSNRCCLTLSFVYENHIKEFQRKATSLNAQPRSKY